MIETSPDGQRLVDRARRLATDGLTRAARRGAVRVVAGNPWVLGVMVIVMLLGGGLMALGLLVAVSMAPPADAAALARAAPALTPTVLAAYLEASEQAGGRHAGCAVRPAVIAAIGHIESGHGTVGGATVDEATGVAAPPIYGPLLDGSLPGTRAVSDTDDGLLDGNVDFDRAVGPMQFLPGSWERFGVDVDGDGVADPHNIFDAAAATVAHLCQAPGPPADLDADPTALRAAILAYNASEVYADRVLAQAATYELLLAVDETGVTVGADPIQLLAVENFSVTPWAAEDLRSGRIDPRAVDLMATLARRWTIHVSTLQTGHSQCVGGGSRATRPDCRESHHWYGRGVDISAVDGSAVSPGNAGALEIVSWLATLPADSPLRPSEVGSPWPSFDPVAGFFHDGAHLDHLHLGWCGARWSGGVWLDPGC